MTTAKGSTITAKITVTSNHGFFRDLSRIAIAVFAGLVTTRQKGIPVLSGLNLALLWISCQVVQRYYTRF